MLALLCSTQLQGSFGKHTAKTPMAKRHNSTKAEFPIKCQQGQREQSSKPDEKAGLGLKAAWVGAEQFGNLLGFLNRKESPATQPKAIKTNELEALTIEKAIELIRSDYDENYFISGKGEMSAYAPDCLFADPFTSFRGVERFKKNVGNLGAAMDEASVKLEILDFSQQDNNSVTSKWRFRCILNLPWRPILAAGGNTTHVLDPQTFKVVEHLERWDTEPGRVLRMLLKPSSKIPRNQWEVLFLALFDGDVKGIWYAVSPQVVRLGALFLSVAWLIALLRDERLEGWGYTLLLAGVFMGLITEVIKFATGMLGGETGTGGRF